MKKLKKLWPNFFIIWVSLLLVTPLFAQQDLDRIEEEHKTQDLDKVIHEFNQNQKQHLDSIEETSPEENQVSEDLNQNEAEANRQDFQQKVKATGYGLSNQSLTSAMKENLKLFHSMSEKEIEKIVRERFSSNPKVHHFLQENPKYVLFLVKLLKDKEAAIKLVEITEQKDKLVQMGLWLLASFVVGFVFSRICKLFTFGFLSWIFFFFVRLIVMTSFRFWIIYHFFGAELAPSVRIAKEVWF